MKIEKGFKTNHVFERSELRTIYYMVEEDIESFTNVVAHMIAEKQNEIESLENELRNLKDN